MPIAQSYPVKITPKGLADALDASDKFPGCCLALTNLVFDQSNPEIMISRPGALSITAFAGFSTPGVISVQITIGTRTYGLISSARNVGKDEPFSYDHALSAFDVVAGITNANTPSTPLTTGAWTPPTMAMIGTKLIVTHPGFPGGATKIGWFDLSVVTAPTWNAGDVATNALPSVPTAVANFFNRAYYACGQTTPYTDVLDGLTRTSGTQALTIGDTSPITALSGLPVQTTSSGVVQALMVFKASQVWQVTGDSATSNLALNFLSLNVGCSSPRSIALSPLGLYFASNAAPYIIDQLGVLRLVVNSPRDVDPDIVAPFQNMMEPSRVAGGYANGIYRVAMETTIRGTQSKNDYWFDERRRRWTGPHSFAYDCVSQYGSFFVISSNDAPGVLFSSRVTPTTGTAYTDNGAATSATLQTATFPKTNHMAQLQVVESTIELSAGGARTVYAITAQDSQQNSLNSTQITVNAAGTAWGAFVWADGTKYASATNRPRVYNVPWTAPLVFQKMGLLVTADANSALSIGSFYARYSDAGYTNTVNP